MRQPLRLQIFLPFALLALVALVLITGISAAIAARARQQETLTRLASVVETLKSAQFPFTPAVLTQMHGLSTAHFVVRDARGAVTASTLPRHLIERIDPHDANHVMLDELTEVPSIRIGSDDYFSAGVSLTASGRGEALQVLLPVRAWRQLRWEAAIPPLAAGLATATAVLLVAGWLAARLTRRLDAIRGQVARIATGVADSLSTGGPDDELRDLALEVNSLSDQLRQHERTVRQTERMRLVAQLANGLAHQLRNAATGARLALQLIQRRHPDLAPRELSVALVQLELIEDHLRKLLTMGPDAQRPRRAGALAEVLKSVEELVAPSCRHSGVDLQFETKAGRSAQVADFDGVRSGLLNLVLNGVEAAGPGGRVAVETRQRGERIDMVVCDSGQGPDPSVADRIFEPFVTSKPEGVGLGLACVRRTVEALGGSVSWTHDATATRFLLSVPLLEHKPARSPAD